MGEEKPAWFADSEGNIPCLLEHMMGDMTG